MADVLYLFLTAIFAGAIAALVAGCSALGARR
jgi:hypothetical protein